MTGGRNGYGAKLCNVFSTKFTVETACKESKKEFKQSWAANMTKASEPKLKEYSGNDYTRITFYPDLVRLFKMLSGLLFLFNLYFSLLNQQNSQNSRWRHLTPIPYPFYHAEHLTLPLPQKESKSI